MSQELDVDKLDSRVCGEDSEDFQSDSQDVVSNEDIHNIKEHNKSEHNIVHSTSQQQQPTPNISKEFPQQTPPTHINTHFKKQTKPFIPNLTIYNATANSSTKENKTVFTKLSEDMYNDFIYGKKPKSKQYDFDSLMNEQFIQSYAEKFKEHNNNKVRNFLARNNKPKCKNNDNTSSTDIKDKKTKEERIKDIQSFLQRQENFKVKKRQRLCDLKEKVYNEFGTNYTAVPQINENSNMIITQLRHNKPSEYNRNVFVKLFEEKCNKTQKETLIGRMQGNGDTKGKEGRNVKQNNKKLTNSEIKELVDNLCKPKSRVKSNGDNNVYIAVNTTPNKDLINQPSNNILIQRFLTNFDNEINKMFNTRIDNNHEVNYMEFKLILYKLGFVRGSNENDSDNNNNKENMLVKEAWCFLLNKHSKQQQYSDNITNAINEKNKEQFPIIG